MPQKSPNPTVYKTKESVAEARALFHEYKRREWIDDDAKFDEFHSTLADEDYEMPTSWEEYEELVRRGFIKPNEFYDHDDEDRESGDDDEQEEEPIKITRFVFLIDRSISIAADWFLFID